MLLPSATLNLNLYRVFYIAAKTQNFSETAKILCTSQPVISRHIKSLEYSLNINLFYRGPKGIELTKEGEELFSFVEKSYNYLLLGEKRLLESQTLDRGKISIGISSCIEIKYISNSIAAFINEYPNMVIKIIKRSSKELSKELLNHSIDLMFDITTNEKVINLNCNNIQLKKIGYSFFYNPDKLGKIANEIKTLEKFPLLLPIKSNQVRTKIDDFLAKNGIKSNVRMEIESYETMVDYVEKGMGIGLVPNMMITKNLRKLHINNISIESNLNLYYFEEILATSTREFLDSLKINIIE
ncbi:MAG: LysR family transcriptional regulator [Bacilli bacterium]|nr:LysR family transcriptional regulator [Bacilli bacterium]